MSLITRHAPLHTEAAPQALGVVERKLWAAVLEMFWHEYQQPELRKPHREQDALWLQSDFVFPGSFVWICEQLGLDPEATRAVMMSATFRGSRHARLLKPLPAYRVEKDE